MYWLIKSEPSTYSIDDLAKEKNKTSYWDGIRNYQARNFMRDDMKVGDLAFFYHSSCPQPGIVGEVKIVTSAYPDHTALDPESKYYDAKSSKDNPRWVMVDLKLEKKYPKLLSLSHLKTIDGIADMQLLKRGNRLSITPVTKKQWQIITKLADHA